MIRCQFEHGAVAHLRHVVVDVLVFDESQKRILLVRRAPHLSHGGKLGVVGGYLDPDETCAQAAKREVLEETGYRITEPKLLEILDAPRPKDERQNVAFVYTATALEQVGEPDDESTEILWAHLDQLPAQQDFAFDHFDHIMRYLESLKKE